MYLRNDDTGVVAGSCQPLRRRSACPYQPDLGVNTVILRGVAPPLLIGLVRVVVHWLLILTGQRHLSPSPLCTLYKMLSVGRLIWLSGVCAFASFAPKYGRKASFAPNLFVDSGTIFGSLLE